MNNEINQEAQGAAPAEVLDTAVNELKSWAGEYCADSDCEYGNDMAMGKHTKFCGILTNAIADIQDGIRSLRSRAARADLEASRDDWMEQARQYCRNMEFYRGLLDECAKHLGEAVYISDDGSKQDEPIRIKIPEMVAALAAERRMRLDGVAKYSTRCFTCASILLGQKIDKAPDLEADAIRKILADLAEFGHPMDPEYNLPPLAQDVYDALAADYTKLAATPPKGTAKAVDPADVKLVWEVVEDLGTREENEAWARIREVIQPQAEGGA